MNMRAPIGTPSSSVHWIGLSITTNIVTNYICATTYFRLNIPIDSHAKKMMTTGDRWIQVGRWGRRTNHGLVCTIELVSVSECVSTWYVNCHTPQCIAMTDWLIGANCVRAERRRRRHRVWMCNFPFNDTFRVLENFMLAIRLWFVVISTQNDIELESKTKQKKHVRERKEWEGEKDKRTRHKTLMMKFNKISLESLNESHSHTNANATDSSHA